MCVDVCVCVCCCVLMCCVDVCVDVRVDVCVDMCADVRVESDLQTDSVSYAIKANLDTCALQRDEIMSRKNTGIPLRNRNLSRVCVCVSS